MRLRDEKGDKYYLLRQFELYLIILYGVVWGVSIASTLFLIGELARR
nr:MAG TPA: hypothetical protein [Caudoviricetes sp.]